MQVAKAWSKDDDDTLLKLRDEGYIWREIAKKMGRSYCSVERRARILQKRIRDKQNIPDIAENVFYQMIKDGKDLGEIVAITGYTEDTIRHQIRHIRQLLSIDDPIKYIPSGWTIDKWKQFLYLRKSGAKNADLSVIFGRHERTLLKLYRRAQQGFYETFSDVLDKNDIGLKLGEIKKKGNLMGNTIGQKRPQRALWNEDEDKKLIALVNEGKCLEEIAKEIGRTERGVSQHFPRLFAHSWGENFPREDILSPRKRILSHWHDNKQKRVKERSMLIQQMRAEGKTAADIAVALKVSKSRAYQLCRIAEKGVQAGSGGMNNINSINNEPIISPTPPVIPPVIFRAMSPEEEAVMMETLRVPPINVEDMKLSDVRDMAYENADLRDREKALLSRISEMEKNQTELRSIIDEEVKKRVKAEEEMKSAQSVKTFTAENLCTLLLSLPDAMRELEIKQKDIIAKQQFGEELFDSRINDVFSKLNEHIISTRNLVPVDTKSIQEIADIRAHIQELEKSILVLEDAITSPRIENETEEEVSPDFQKFLAESVAKTADIWGDEPKISPEEAKRETDLLEMRGKKWTMPWKRESQNRRKHA